MRAVTPATVLYLARADFEQSVGMVPELRAYFEAMAAKRTRDNSEKMGGAALRHAARSAAARPRTSCRRSPRAWPSSPITG